MGLAEGKAKQVVSIFKQIKAQQQNNYAITDFTADNKAVKLGSFCVLRFSDM